VRGVASEAHPARDHAPWSVKTTGLPLLWPMVGYNGGGRGDSAGAQEGISGRRRWSTGCSAGRAGGRGQRCGLRRRRGRRRAADGRGGSLTGQAGGRRAIRTSRLRKEVQEF
jgi:hypothetical protein